MGQRQSLSHRNLLHDWILRPDCPLSPNQRLVALALASHLNRKGEAWPGVARLRSLTALGKTAVIESLAALCYGPGASLRERQERIFFRLRGGHGGQHGNGYLYALFESTRDRLQHEIEASRSKRPRDGRMRDRAKDRQTVVCTNANDRETDSKGPRDGRPKDRETVLNPFREPLQENPLREETPQTPLSARSGTDPGSR